MSVAPVVMEGDDTAETMRRFTERLTERLRPLEQRIQGDDRFRRAETVVGFSAVALGALRGTQPLTFAGTHALRLGLHNQLKTLQERSGFVVEPSIGHRSISITLSRTFE